MIGLVIVSHSGKIAAGVCDLAEQMTQGQVPLAAAGGIDDPDNPIGTDALKIMTAIESIYQDDDVLVLMDLGSAILSAETALDFLPPEQQARVHLCAAPLVEGAIAAAVQASVGSSIEAVIAEAENSLTPKQTQLGTMPVETVSTRYSSDTSSTTDKTLQLTIQNKMGLHARPAAKLVKTVSRYQAEVQISKDGKVGNAKSIGQVTTLGIRYGETITMTINGPDAGAALKAVKALADEHFGERDEAVETVVATAPSISATPSQIPNELIGIPASPGIAIGPVFQYRPKLPPIVTRTVENSEAECDKLQTALAQTERDLKALQQQAKQQIGTAEAEIFEAHALFLQDPDLTDATKQKIKSERINAEAAWQQTFEQMADQFSQLDDAYFKTRATDIRDLGQQVLRHLIGVETPSLHLSHPVIIIAADLSPSDTARLDTNHVLGLVMELGGATSHSAILARALGIPAIVGLSGGIADLPDGQTIALNGNSGQLWLQPKAAHLADLEQQRQQWQQSVEQAKAIAQRPAITQDGQVIDVAANIGGPNDTAVALEYGAAGVGLLRSEFLFMDREQPPSEAEQFAAYKQVAQAMGQHPVIIRTLDVGGDKPLPYLDLGHEENPFLGWRGIRFCLQKPDLFKPQLRAILRASAYGQVKLMFPMIGTLTELQATKQMLADVQDELRAAAIEFDADMQIGIMIEVPSAVAMANQLAAEIDFFSIGSNDLTQYVMAADRGNRNVANLAQGLHPAVLRMIQQTTQAAQAANIWVGMCGELAGNPLATPILLGLGVSELSMSAPNIPAVKTVIQQLTLSQAQDIAAHALSLTSAEAVQTYLESTDNLSTFP